MPKSVSVTILTPFLKTAIGKTDNARIAFLDVVFRNNLPAIILVMKRAILERIPLHCSATSMLKPGR